MKVIPKYIILHWSGGNYIPNSIDMKHYDLMITKDGVLIKGINEFKSDKAATAGMNSITYNIACCGGLKETPITKVQAEKLFKTVADKCKLFGLTPDKVYTHHEIGEMTRNYLDFKKGIKKYDIDKRKITGFITELLTYNQYLPGNVGKVDLTSMPYPNMSPVDIRNKVRWYYNRL